jgi:hypothetical protein
MGLMKPEEQIASVYLEALGFGKPNYEPAGNVPPDFLLHDSIAIEVRRLNKQIVVDGESVGLEQAEVPLMKGVDKILREFDSKWTGKSFWVFPRFSRPIPERKLMRVALENALTDYLTLANPGRKTATLCPTLSIELCPATPVSNRTFMIGGNSDPDRGGWVVADYLTNLQLCSDEKEVKISQYREKYPRWWLLLIDFLGPGLDEFDRDQLVRARRIVHRWEKIILVDPMSKRSILEF